MRTPYGQDCKYYYADFHRGRHEQVCRLAEANPASETWQPDVCRSCPVPEILRANACEYLVLNGRVVKGLLGFGRKMVVEASLFEDQTRRVRTADRVWRMSRRVAVCGVV